MAKLGKRKAASDRVGKIAITVAIALVLAYMAWFFTTHERVDTGVLYRTKSEAAKNPYFAATLLLNQQGRASEYIVPSQMDRRLKALWQDTKTANQYTIVLNRIHALSSSQLAEIEAWVQAGGHLVVFAQNSYNDEMTQANYQQDENPILVHFGIQNIHQNMELVDNKLNLYPWHVAIRVDNQVLILPSDGSRLDSSEFEKKYPKAHPVANYWALGGQVSLNQLSQDFYELEPSQKQQLFDFSKKNSNYSDPKRAIVDFYLGQGRLTVLNRSINFQNPWSNSYVLADTDAPKASSDEPRILRLLRGREADGKIYYGNINELDNAYMLSYLAKDRQTLWFVRGISDESTGFMMLVADRLPFALAAFILAVLAMLFGLPRQFGRRQMIDDDSDRNLMKYFDNVGQYLWASDLCLAQVSANRERLQEKIRARLPRLQRLDNQQACQLIAEDAKLPVCVVYEALYGTWQNQSGFVKISRSFALLANVYL